MALDHTLALDLSCARSGIRDFAFGQSLVQSAFYSGEQLARSLSEFLLWCIGGVWLGLVVLEWLARVFILRRRTKRLSASPAQTE